MPPDLRAPLILLGSAVGLAGLVWAKILAPITGGRVQGLLLCASLGFFLGSRLTEDLGRFLGMRGREFFQALLLALASLVFLSPVLIMGADGLFGAWLGVVAPGAPATQAVRALLPFLLLAPAGFLTSAGLVALFQEWENLESKALPWGSTLGAFFLSMAAGTGLGLWSLHFPLGHLAPTYLAAGFTALAALTSLGDSRAPERAPASAEREGTRPLIWLVFFAGLWSIPPLATAAEILSWQGVEMLPRLGGLAVTVMAWAGIGSILGGLCRSRPRAPSNDLIQLAMAIPLGVLLGFLAPRADLLPLLLMAPLGLSLGLLLESALQARQLDCSSGVALSGLASAGALALVVGQQIHSHLLLETGGPAGVLITSSGALFLMAAYVRSRELPALGVRRPVQAAFLVILAEIIALSTAHLLGLPAFQARLPRLSLHPRTSLRALGHLPLSQRVEEDTRVLALDTSGGEFLEAVLGYPLASVDVATPSRFRTRRILQSSREVYPGVARDPRLHLQEVDPWTLLRAWPEQVDLILAPAQSELPGRDFYRLCRSRLRTGGWLGICLPDCSAKDMRTVLRDIELSFPHMALYWFGDWVLLASESSLDFDLDRARTRLAETDTPWDPASLGDPASPEEILRRRVAGSEVLRVWASNPATPESGTAPGHTSPQEGAPEVILPLWARELLLNPLQEDNLTSRGVGIPLPNGDLLLPQAGLRLARPLADLTTLASLRRPRPKEPSGSPAARSVLPPLETLWTATLATGSAELRSSPRARRPDAHREHQILAQESPPRLGDEIRHGPHDALWAVYEGTEEGHWIGLYTWNCRARGRSHSLSVQFQARVPSSEMLLDLARQATCFPH